MNRFFAGLTLLITQVTLAGSFQSPEVLHLDVNTPSKFLISNSLHENTIELNNQLGSVNVDLHCDGPVKLRNKSPSGNNLSFKMKNAKKVDVVFSKEVNACALKVNDREIQLVKDEVAFPFLKKFHNNLEDCRYQTNTGDLFLTNEYPMMSCAHESQKMDILEDSEEAFISKLETLVGYRVSKEFIRNQNPYAELDFSQAPKLDAIFVSTLLYRNDFTGVVLARALKHHAKEGALVNIIGTGWMHEEKDKALLKELTQYSENLRIQEFKYIKPGIKFPTQYLVDYWRDMHVKMFVTISFSEPDNNVLITGGRNVHDGFLYSTKPDLSKYPNLSQFPEGPYAYWQDLEVKIKGETLVKSVYSHLLKLWNREVNGQKTSDISVARREINGDDVLNSKSPMMRHILSLPYNDDQALEKLFVDMIDRAQTSIKLSSPYLRPTKKIMKAMERAISRNVEIIIQTRINLEGDTQAWLYEETNKSAINAFFEKTILYEWTDPSILHTKMTLIDNKFAFFGSVNLSRRSFVQDVESGLLIHSEEEVGRLNEVFMSYAKNSKRIEKKQKRKFWASILVGLFENQF